MFLFFLFLQGSLICAFLQRFPLLVQLHHLSLPSSRPSISSPCLSSLPASPWLAPTPAFPRESHGGEPGRVEPFPVTTRVSPCWPFPLSPVLFPLCSPEELLQPCLQPHLLPPLGLCRGLRMGAHLHYGSGMKEIKVKSFPQAFRVL